jgi:acyl-coenzyme A thioesterase PaaI-like protein
MLDDAIGAAVLIATDAKYHPVTIDLNVSFLAPAWPGPLFAEAAVLRLGRASASPRLG